MLLYDKRLADQFCRFGTIKQTRVKRRPIVNETNAAVILALAALNPYANSRQMEKKSGISNYFLKRINFCIWIRIKMRKDVSFLSHVLFLMKLTSQIREM